MLLNVTFSPSFIGAGGDAIRAEVLYNQHTIIAYIPIYLLDNLVTPNQASSTKSSEQYIAIFNQHQKIMLEKIVGKFYKNEQKTIHLIANDFMAWL